MMDTVYLHRKLIICSGFISIPFVSFMSCSSVPVTELRVSASIPQFSLTPSWRIVGFYLHLSSIAEELLESLLYSNDCTAHDVATLLYTPKSVSFLENISHRMYLTVYHKYLFHTHVKASDETFTESLASNTQKVKAKV
jgi:hypothetical protein